MSDTTTQLQQKLKQSNLARQALERTYEAQFNNLSQFIFRLSNVCKGMDLELDNKLAKLRIFLNNNTDLENIEPLLFDINELMKHHTVRVTNNMRSTQDSIINAGKKLQQQKGLPDQFRRDLRGLLKATNEPHDSIVNYIPKLELLVELYHQAHALQSDNHKHSENTNEEKLVLQNKISHELLNVLSNIAFSGHNANQIEQIRHQLTIPVTAEQQVDICVEVIKMIISSLTEERESAQSFLLNLNQALSSVHDVVATSISGSKKSHNSKASINQQLKQNLVEMEKEINQATDLDTLKSQINSRLSDIASSIAVKEAIEQDEQDQLLKSLTQLQSRLAELELEAEDYKKRLSEQQFKSLQDSLTKLPNRAAFDERLDLEYKRWQRNKTGLCLAVADIDYFKQVNDRFGHLAGDKTLQVIAMALKKSLRQTDFIARYGGEEFVFLFPESDIKAIELKLNEIREKIRKIPFKFKNVNINISISIGATQFKENDQPRAVFDRADTALYQAKHNGRNMIVIN